MNQEENLNLEPQEQKETPETPEVPARDYTSEVSKLIEDFPEVSENYMTEEVFQRLITSEKPLTDAFREYRHEKEMSDLRTTLGERDSRITELEKELAVFRQNAEAASRAPVTPVTDGGSAENDRASDPVLMGIFS